jgi:hypothetical protein
VVRDRSGAAYLSDNLVPASTAARTTALPEGIPMNDIRDIVCKGIVIGNLQGSTAAETVQS